MNQAALPVGTRVVQNGKVLRGREMCEGWVGVRREVFLERV